MVLDDKDDVQDQVLQRLASQFDADFNEIKRAYNQQPENVRRILQRHEYAVIKPSDDRPVCNFIDHTQFTKALSLHSYEKALFTLARLYDEAHVALYRACRSGKPRYEQLQANKNISLQECGLTLQTRSDAVDDQIFIEPISYGNAPYKAVFREITKLSFDQLPRLRSLSDTLPGERTDSRRQQYAGMGGGGGSDIISASILGVLLNKQPAKEKKTMNLLVSTRTWATGSQGKKGAKIGAQREVQDHGGHVNRDVKENGQVVSKPVGGTYKILKNTSAEGRHLENIPLNVDHPRHKDIWLVLDQGESTDVPDEEKAKLEDQFEAILDEHDRITTVLSVDSGGSVFNGGESRLDTIISVDTGGDVFGVDATGGTTPDQDYRVQKAIFEMNKKLKHKHGLVTAVVAPGVDAPRDAPKKALEAGGKRYVLTQEDKETILELLKDYQMDGSNPDRFGKTTLALQARLNGALGWTSLNLPEYVIDTWDNPWNSFVYIRECMSDIILMPTKSLLDKITPPKEDPSRRAQQKPVRLTSSSPTQTHATLNGLNAKEEKSPARSPTTAQPRRGSG